MKTILAIDFDEWACGTYRANFPGVRVECGPVLDFVPTLPRADVVMGGPPCQGFSLAGEGLGEHDERDGIPDFIDAVCRVQPRHFLMENVRGLITSKHWPYFCRVIDRLTEEAGYVVQWKLLDAVNYGVPQFRERVWVWGIRKDLHAGGMRHSWPMATHAWPPPEPCMFGATLLPGVTVGQALGIGDVRDVRVAMGEKPKFSNGPNERDNSPAFCLDQKPYHGISVIGGGYNPPAGQPERRTERDITDEPSTTIATTTGNAMSKVIEYRWSDEMLRKHPPASPASPAPTIQSKWFKGGAEGLVECVIDPKHPFQQQQQPATTITSGGNGHGPTGNSLKLAVDTKQKRTRRSIEEPAPTVGGDSRHQMSEDGQPANLLPCPTISAGSHQGGPEPVNNRIRAGFVRRLTSLECARLQSMPDDFVWPDKITKNNMYRIVGNGQASLMVSRLSEAMRAVDPEAETVIDLFCGGGVGAVGWHGRAWKLE